MKGQYIQIYDTSINNPGFHMLVEKCGCDSVIFLDGRLSLGSCIEIGIEHCRKNNLKGFRVMKKIGYNWNNILSDLYRVSPTTVEC